MRYLLMVLAAIGWLWMVSEAKAQEIHRESFVGTWCLVASGEASHSEVYTADEVVVWSLPDAQYRGVWYWLPMIPGHFMVEFGNQRILLHVLHVDDTTLQVQDVRTGQVRRFTRGLCSAGG